MAPIKQAASFRLRKADGKFEPLVQVSAEVYQIKSLERIRWYAGTASPSCKNNSDLFDDKQGEGQSLSLRGTIKAAKKAEYGG
jgi:hypothetical protein